MIVAMNDSTGLQIDPNLAIATRLKAFPARACDKRIRRGLKPCQPRMKEQNCLEIEYEGEEINKRRNRSFNGNLNRTSYEPQSKKNTKSTYDAIKFFSP